jgi:hypothetical protein
MFAERKFDLACRVGAIEFPILFVEPQFTVLDRGDNQPQFQLFLGFNMPFN